MDFTIYINNRWKNGKAQKKPCTTHKKNIENSKIHQKEKPSSIFYISPSIFCRKEEEKAERNRIEIF
jgi:hypothetical protein